MQNKIIEFLKNSKNYISGEEISRNLKMSRAAIWKYMQELRRDGYDIVAVPHLGYRLVSSPDKLFPHEVQSNLDTKVLGKKIVYFDSIHSTMDHAFELGMAGEDEGTVVCAESQTKGKGRLGRSWSSPKGKGIYMSIILRPSLLPSNVAQLTLLAAVATCEAIRKTTSVAAKIKWPNDILINDKKVAGILTELSAEVDRVRFVVVGVGVNVNTALKYLPKQGTSLKNETKKMVSRVELLQEILRLMEQWYQRVNAEGFSPVMKRWKELSSTLGKRIRLIDAGGKIEGKAIDLDRDGGLIIRSDSGIAVKRMSGDIIQVG